jgi:hypothetical protein
LIEQIYQFTKSHRNNLSAALRRWNGKQRLPLLLSRFAGLKGSLNLIAINKKYKQPPSRLPALRKFCKREIYKTLPMSQANLL